MRISFNAISTALFGLSKKHCEMHIAINKTLEKITAQQLLNTDHIAQNTKRLDIGTEDFKEIRESIAGLDKSYALLAQKINAETKTLEEEEK